VEILAAAKDPAAAAARRLVDRGRQEQEAKAARQAREEVGGWGDSRAQDRRTSRRDALPRHDGDDPGRYPRLQRWKKQNVRASRQRLPPLHERAVLEARPGPAKTRSRGCGEQSRVGRHLGPPKVGPTRDTPAAHPGHG
jgi:hypothetical protein